MELGFLGTGEITAAMVAGLCSGGAAPHSIGFVKAAIARVKVYG
jgi:pyrroline-5-carboxylate reductase